MRLRIDLDKCINSGQCAYLQPDLFDVDDDGVPSILISGDLDDGHLAKAHAVADVCPSQSISLVDKPKDK